MSNNKTKTVQEVKEQFIQECTILDPNEEYPGYTGIEKYLIITTLSETELKSKYASLIEPFKPYLLLDTSFIDARTEFNRNSHKHEMRAQRTEDIFGYVDGETEIFHKELVTDNLYDDFIKSIEIDEVYEAAEQLSKTQRERFIMYYRYGLSSRKIAEMQHVNHSAVNKSLILAIEQIKRILNIT